MFPPCQRLQVFPSLYKVWLKIQIKPERVCTGGGGGGAGMTLTESCGKAEA